jgi:putative oxygen-independent coproporphyrinogen III oxidase
MPQDVNQAHPKSLYVHIPFCDHLCHYCDFTKMLTNRKQTLPYVLRVLEEIQSYGMHRYDTIFFGGGTPTALEDEAFKTLCDGVAPYLAPSGEWSVECNVESTTPSKFAIMKAAGVNRLSFGVQTFKNEALKALNRHHDDRDIIRIVAEAKAAGFHRINIDLIYDLPKVSDADLQEDLMKFIALDVDHIATYALTIHPHTVFGIQKVPQVSDEISRRHYETIYQTLTAHGYDRYEVSNFARNQAYARHNLTYWRNQPYVGCGLGASGYIDGVRYTNTKNMTKYLQGLNRAQEEVITPAMKKFEYIMLNLRLKNGFSRTEFQNIFAEDFLNAYANKAPSLIEKGLLKVDQEQVYTTFEGMMLLDYVVVKLTSE